MGDRTGLSNYDRTNGYEDSNGYMQAKKVKLADQNEAIRNALIERHKSMRSTIFKGLSIHVNGKTKPTADELKRLILLNGGQYDPKMYKTTKFMIATNLSFAKSQSLRACDKVVRPEWITDSISAKTLLNYEDYQLFGQAVQTTTGTIISIVDLTNDDSKSSNSSFATTSASTSTISSSMPKVKTKKHIKTRNSSQREEPRCMDIRQMFANATNHKQL